jgi:beta-lactamase regulating signal transducer with metallopeptidase domain
VDDLLSTAVSNAVAATVLALMAVIVGAVYRRPALVHGLWLLVLLKLVTPPLLLIPVAWPTAAELPSPEIASVREEPTVAPPPVAEEPRAGEWGYVSAPRESTAPDIEDPPSVDALGALTQPRSPEPPLWPQLLRIVWAVGALAWFFLALERLHRFRRLLRFARPAPAALQERTRRLAHSLGLKRCPRVRLLPGRIAPMLWAIGGPSRLLVPADLLNMLSDEQLDTLLLHELAHLRRRDHWVRILEFVVMGLYWWHPVVWYARRELREAEEQCCDAWVVSTLPGTGRTYASALLDTLDFLSTAQAAIPPLASGLGQIADLKRRLTMIMRGNTPRSLTWPGCLAIITLGLTFLPMLPSLHGQQPSQEELGKFVADEQDAKSALDKAKADLELQKARLEQQKANLAAAEAEWKKAVAAMEQQKKVRQAAIYSLGQWSKPKIGENKAKIAITIVIDADDIDVSELDKKLRAMFPQKDTNIHISIAKGRHIELKSVPPTPNIAPPKPVAPPAPPKAPSSREDKRINDLEKKLEKVLQELHDLRKQMKESPSGQSSRNRPLNRSMMMEDRPLTGRLIDYAGPKR